MRSSTFIILSLIVHLLIVAAVALAPTRSIEPLGSEVEVSLGEPAETPGVETAQEVAPVPPATAPVPEPVKAAPVVKATPPAPKKQTVAKKAAPTPTKQATIVEKTDEPTEKIEEAAAPSQAATEELTPEIQNMDEVAKEEAAPVAPVAAIAAKDEDAKTEATSPEATAPGPETQDGGDLGKGGATQAAAVAYTDLKQAKGNTNPVYPLKARKEQRQGQVELVYRVTKDGKVADVQIAKSSGHADLDQAAVRAVSKFKFVPSQEGWAYHPVNFALKGDSAPLPSRLRTAGSEGAE